MSVDPTTSTRIPMSTLEARIRSAPMSAIRDPAQDPYADLPDHAYWARVLPAAQRRDAELCSILHLMRVFGARLVLTERGHLRLDVHPVFCLDPPEFEMSEDEFKRQELEPRKQTLLEVFREVEGEI